MCLKAVFYNGECQISKVEVKSGKSGDTRQLMDIFTFDLKPEKLVYCSVKVNGRFLIKSDARAMTDDQTTRNKPAKSQYKASKKPATNQQKRIEINTHTRVNFSLRRTFAGSNHA